MMGLRAEKAKLLHDLKERVKELAALHSLRDVLQGATGPAPATPKLLRRIATLLPAAWQYPEATAARLTLGKQEVATRNFVRSRWRQQAKFSLIDGTQGMVEVAYLEPRPGEDEGPFLEEERNLINSIAATLKIFLDHRLTEEKLRQSDDRFHRALKNWPIAVFSQDKKLRYTWVYNATPPQTAETMIGNTDEDLFPPPEALLLRRIKKRVLRTGNSAREEVRVTIKGRPVFYDLAIEPLRDSARRITGITCAAMDITKRKRAEADRSFLASIVESSEDAIFVRTLKGVILTWNAGAGRMFGYSPQEAVGRPVSMLIPADRAEEVFQITAKIERGERMEHYETVRLRKDGSPIYVSLTNSPIRDAEGTVTGVSTIARDIAKRKQLELEILDINETLQRRVGQDLHDGLNQELRGIACLGHALQQALLEKGLPEAQTSTRITELLQRAISQAGDLARGLAPLRLEADGLMAALNELAAGTKSIYGIPCSFVCPRSVLVSNRSTAIHLYRIAQEAVHNAIKHGAPRSVIVALTQAGSCIKLTVKDDGKGLPANLVKCTGMGLKIMNYRASTIGGVLKLEQAAGGGTLVSCVLPIAPRNTVESTV